jgi:hypothetical protein
MQPFQACGRAAYPGFWTISPARVAASNVIGAGDSINSYLSSQTSLQVSGPNGAQMASAKCRASSTTTGATELSQKRPSKLMWLLSHLGARPQGDV